MNIAGDGHNTKLYFVDNDNTASRIRFAGVSVFEQGPQLGSTLEVGFSPNNSFDVSQDNELAGGFVDVRRAEVWVRDDRYGRLMFGRGSAPPTTPANTTSRCTRSIMTSVLRFIAGGLQFVATTGSPASPSPTRSSTSTGSLRAASATTRRCSVPLKLPPRRRRPELRRCRHSAATTTLDRRAGRPLTMLGALSIAEPNVHGVDFRMVGSWSMLPTRAASARRSRAASTGPAGTTRPTRVRQVAGTRQPLSSAPPASASTTPGRRT